MQTRTPEAMRGRAFGVLTSAAYAAGPVGYPSSGDLRAALHATPAHLLLLETDAPYLPPHPFRGRPNGPYLVAETAAQVAAELDLDLAELSAQVWRTSHELYGPW